MSMPGAWPVEEDEVSIEMPNGRGSGVKLEKKTSLLRSGPTRTFPLDLTSKDTPTGRPLAEPPMFNYDDFVRRFVPSDKRFRLLFPERRDVGKMTDDKDRHIEIELLNTYLDWIWEAWPSNYTEQYIEERPPHWDRYRKETKQRHEFYQALGDDLWQDRSGLVNELSNLRKGNNKPGTCLAAWEFAHLDDDLGTKQIERDLANYRDEIFEEFNAPPEAREKYQHLFPAAVDDDFRYWHCRTKELLEKEKAEKEGMGLRMEIQKTWILYTPVNTTEGLAYHIGEEAEFAESAGAKSKMILTRIYKGGGVEYINDGRELH